MEREVNNQGQDIVMLLDRVDERSEDAKRFTTREVTELRGWVQDALDGILTRGWRLRVFGVGALLAGLLFGIAGVVVG